MRSRAVVGALAATVVLAAGAVTPAFAHEGGHKGGCEDFGQANQTFAPNLGPLVSDFARAPDGRGVGDIVENVDHVLGCG